MMQNTILISRGLIEFLANISSERLKEHQRRALRCNCSSSAIHRPSQAAHCLAGKSDRNAA